MDDLYKKLQCLPVLSLATSMLVFVLDPSCATLNDIPLCSARERGELKVFLGGSNKEKTSLKGEGGGGPLGSDHGK